MKDDRFTAQHADHQGPARSSLERMGAGTTTFQVAQLLKDESAYGSSSPAQSGISSGSHRILSRRFVDVPALGAFEDFAGPAQALLARRRQRDARSRDRRAHNFDAVRQTGTPGNSCGCTGYDEGSANPEAQARADSLRSQRLRRRAVPPFLDPCHCFSVAGLPATEAHEHRSDCPTSLPSPSQRPKASWYARPRKCTHADGPASAIGDSALVTGHKLTEGVGHERPGDNAPVEVEQILLAA